ncbi:hypothetical protein SAMD00019534_113980, partial [Acytostelium subglobosum LB1]|uniref:hypothetical protein n=1 Tax=Acytostelium subglobosum LB1 TaxID=1410327 RepID=UPI00064493CC
MSDICADCGHKLKYIVNEGKDDSVDTLAAEVDSLSVERSTTTQDINDCQCCSSIRHSSNSINNIDRTASPTAAAEDDSSMIATPQQPTPPILKIMKRNPSNTSSNSLDRNGSKKSQQPVTLEEKQAAYNKARERIFQDSIDPLLDSGLGLGGVDSTSTSSSLSDTNVTNGGGIDSTTSASSINNNNTISSTSAPSTPVYKKSTLNKNSPNFVSQLRHTSPPFYSSQQQHQQQQQQIQHMQPLQPQPLHPHQQQQQQRPYYNKSSSPPHVPRNSNTPPLLPNPLPLHYSSPSPYLSNNNTPLPMGYIDHQQQQ